jgi:hypothetical protein
MNGPMPGGGAKLTPIFREGEPKLRSTSIICPRAGAANPEMRDCIYILQNIEKNTDKYIR